ncbi:MAG: hypothetical protein AB7D43_13175 [Sulfurimonadaceae bacterium]
MSVFDHIQAKIRPSCSFGHAQANARNIKSLQKAKKEIEILMDKHKNPDRMVDDEKKN